MLRKRETIETERLIIKVLEDEDANALVDLFMDPDINKTFMVPEFESRNECMPLARMFIGMSDPDDIEHFVYGVYLEGELIGFVNDCGIEGEKIEIGYVISPAHQGKGYATEVFAAAIDELRRMGFRTVTAGYFEENPASRRVMEKCGLKPIDLVETGVYRGEVHKCLYCAIDL